MTKTLIIRLALAPLVLALSACAVDPKKR